MAKTKISEFSSTPANNTDIDSINIAEGCAPSNINDAIRELMAQLKDFQIGSQGDSFNGPIGTTTAAAGAFTTLSASSTVTLSGGTANGVTYLNGSKQLVSGSALTFNGSVLYTNGKIGVGETNPTALVEARNTSIARMDADASAVYFGSGNNYPVVFKQNDTEGMRLTSTGLGIGTSSPTDQLTLYGGKVRVCNSTTGTSSGIVMGMNSNDAYISNQANGYILFGTNNTERMRLDSAGNLGLGVTPSAWGSNYKALQIGAQTALYNAVGYVTSLNTNAYENSSGTLLRIAAGEATRYVQASGVHQWFTAGNGTAGSTISFTQAMTLDASGNLLVGTTTQYGSGKISVPYSSAAYGIVLKSTTADAANYAIEFKNSSNSGVGAIYASTTTTTYATSSDYRLKNITGALTGYKERLMSLLPKQGTWIADGSEFRGFLAHEFANPYCASVTGEKDAVDADGKPVMQGMQASSSEVMADLVAMIQEQQAIIQQLQADVAALKGN